MRGPDRQARPPFCNTQHGAKLAQPRLPPHLRAAAMAGIGATRLAMDYRRNDPGDRLLLEHLAGSLALLRPA